MNEEKEYTKRVSDELILLQLESAGIVLIEGAKWCGKTTSAMQYAGSVVFMDDPNHMDDYMKLVENNIGLLLSGENPRLFDEWQKAPP